MKKITLLIIISLFCIAQLEAQEGITQHFMQYNPYSNIENPANFTPINGYFSFPGLSNFNLSLTNTGFKYNKLFKTDSIGRPTTVTADKFVNSLSKYGNWLNLNLDEEILGFGFRVKRLFFSFSYRVKMDEYFRYSKDLFALPLNGNMSYTGENNPADIDLNLSMTAYQEFSLGVQAEITKRLSIGIRPKFLLGMAAVRTNEFNAKLYTDAETYDMTLQYNADITLMSAIPVSVSDSNKITFNTDDLMQNWQSLLNNRGFACDIGAKFKINEHIGVAASMTDWGFINWKTKGIRITSAMADAGEYYSNGSFYFAGFTADEINRLINDGEFSSNLLDSLKEYFPYSIEEYTTTTYLNAKFSAEFYYQINPKHRFSAFFQGTMVKNNFYHRITFAYNGHFGKVLDLCGTYSIMPDSYANFGIGLGLRLGIAYLYLATDNILGYFTPLNVSNVNTQLGLVFKWGKAEERELKKDNSN
jgi:hypothetical protein